MVSLISKVVLQRDTLQRQAIRNHGDGGLAVLKMIFGRFRNELILSEVFEPRF